MSSSLNDAAALSTDEKRLLLAEMLAEKTRQPKIAPLSFGQERLRLIVHLDPNDPVYHIAVRYRLSGLLDVPALKQGLQSIAQRHESLRTTFPTVEGQTVQRIHPDARPALLEVSLQDVPADMREAKARQLAQEEAKLPFDLVEGPLWRVKLFRFADDDHSLLLVMHHIVSDGWSFHLFCQELVELYDAFRKSQPLPLADLTTQYADFANRQRQLLSGTLLEEQSTYWQRHLAGLSSSLALPTDHPTPVQPTHRGSSQSFALSTAVSDAINELSLKESSTPFMTVLAAFQVLLYQYSGQTDMMICTPVMSRHRSQTKHLIGYFNNILPMRFDLTGNPTFLDLLRRTRQVALAAYRHQDLPFETIVSAAKLHQVALTPVLFSLDMPWPPKLELADLGCHAEDVPTGMADFDLGISIWVTDSQTLAGAIKYKTDLFDASTVDRLIAEYRALLAQLVADPEQSLAALPRYRDAVSDRSVSAIEPVRSPYTAPRTPMELRIAKEWEEILGIEAIGVEDDILAMGASSLAIARISERIQSLFGTKLSLASMFQARTVVQLAALLQESHAHAPASSLAAIQPHGRHRPLFLCEGVGIYYPLCQRLGRDQPVYGLFSEVIEDYPRIEDLAAHYISEIQTIQPAGPYSLGGISFGGLVAFEMAQQLQAKGHDVALVALFDTPGPQAVMPKSRVRKTLGHLSNLRRFGLRYLEMKLGHRLPKLALRLSNRSAAIDRSSAPIYQGPELRSLFMESASRYEVKPYRGRLTLFTLAHRDAMNDSLFDPALVDIDPYLGWRNVATEGVDLYEHGGGHITLLQEPHVRGLAENLAQSLLKVNGAA